MKVRKERVVRYDSVEIGSIYRIRWRVSWKLKARDSAKKPKMNERLGLCSMQEYLTRSVFFSFS